MKEVRWFLFGALVATAVCMFLSFKACDVKDQEIVKLKSKVTTQGDVIEKKTSEYDALKSERDEKIAELNGMIDSSNTVVMRKEEEIATQDKKLKELREANKVLTNKDEIIENLKDQIIILDKKFTLARQQLDEKDKIIFALNKKYEAEHRLRLQGEDVIEALVKQVDTQGELIDKLEKKIAYQSRVAWYWKVGGPLAGILLGVLAD